MMMIMMMDLGPTMNKEAIKQMNHLWYSRKQEKIMAEANESGVLPSGAIARCNYSVVIWSNTEGNEVECTEVGSFPPNFDDVEDRGIAVKYLRSRKAYK